jgi:uncharacterized SAM-binding protein YcdF (DUF218 family)
MPWMAGMLLAPVLVVLMGFGLFLARLDRYEVPLSIQADGIVALTGGAERISDAVHMLSEGQGRRLLITGVHATTSPQQVASQTPGHQHYFNCCIDLDHRATNTAGNAEETRRWARAHHMRSLLVVTSNYHMPRSLVELRRYLPDTKLIPAPVVSERQRTSGLVGDAGALRVLFVEYAKFVVAYARARLTKPPAADDIITASAPRRS